MHLCGRKKREKRDSLQTPPSVGRKKWKATSKKERDEVVLPHSVMHLVVHGTVSDSLVLFLHILLLQGQGCIQRRGQSCRGHGLHSQLHTFTMHFVQGSKDPRLLQLLSLLELLGTIEPDSPQVGASPATMVGLVGAVGPVVCMHERRSQKIAPRQPLHGHSGGEGGLCGWIFVGDHQLRCDLVPPIPCLISCRRNTPSCILGAPSSSPSACPTKSFVRIFSHKYGSYVVFHGCNPTLGSNGVVLHAWLR
ncbi:unnamed protein product [Sphenostylis stenocarpa]|uniref:Uncharacterized protein n=1 Tax=Sphenostylis stenocarpa TaxID=92480 RepID=A0AA86SFL5_9FABA|nr:unnamed protein product [Sphenostylis stenocarpa]